MSDYTVRQSRFAHFFTSDTRSAPFWLLVRLYIGYEWLMAGYTKFLNPAWFGTEAGAALQGFVQGALGKTGGAHPDVQMWYASFLQNAVLPHATIWANAVTLGEIAVGLGLIVGLCTRAAAFWSVVMSLDYLLAGTVSVNPITLMLALGILSAHRVAGYWGLDRFVRPFCNRFCPLREKNPAA